MRTMYKFAVEIKVDGKNMGPIYVEATDPGMAKRAAVAETSGRAGYAGKKITAGGYKKL